MITIFISSEHTYTWSTYLAAHGDSLASRVEFIPYGEKVDVRSIPAGTVIFTDLERLVLGHKRAAIKVHREISRQRPDITLINSPQNSLLRYDLLSVLKEADVNRFRVYRADQDWSGARFPVFVRIADDHGAPRTKLLYNAADVESEIRALTGFRWEGLFSRKRKSNSDSAASPEKRSSARLDISLPKDNSLMGRLCRIRRRLQRPKDIVVCEFIDTSDANGLYHKYGAFVVDGRIVPAHLWFSENWVVKFGSSRQEPEYCQRELDYIRDNPHAKLLQRVCELANIQYGRIDYSVDSMNRIAVWEINTNPVVVPYISNPEIADKREPSHELFAIAFNEALRNLPWKPREGVEAARLDQPVHQHLLSA
ncbi:hypothetical protein EWI61_10150 [Methylolobus aquaticus]|nr:hypothetical protein EWI61_10150 [Methylolobus aquaticus]